jgi:hypothetical protein
MLGMDQIDVMREDLARKREHRAAVAWIRPASEYGNR